MKHIITVFHNGRRQEEIILNNLQNYNKGILLFGRSPKNDVVLPFPTVSRVHGEIVINESVVRISDLGGLNKLTLDGVTISEAILNNGTEIIIGPQREAPGAVSLVYTALKDKEFEPVHQQIQDKHTSTVILEKKHITEEMSNDNEVQKAKILDRAIAGAVDYIIWFVLWMALLMVTAATKMPLGIPLGMGSAIIVGWIYFASMESSQKRATLGKIIMGIVVADKYGQKINFMSATKRFFVKLLSTIILGLGLLPIYGKMTLHDKICGTRIIKS